MQLALDKLLDYAEAIEARHLDIQKHQVGIVLFDQRNGFETIFAHCDHVDLRKTLQKIKQLVARGAFVIHYDCVDGHECV